jgi:hypothetical protein
MDRGGWSWMGERGYLVDLETWLEQRKLPD